MSIKNKTILDIFIEISKQVENYLVLNKKSKLDIFYKYNFFDDKEAVTNLDKDIENICIGIIKSNFKDIQIISEENHSKNKLYNNHSYFVLDPVDGTNELIKGSDNWSLSIAYVNKRRPVVAMLYFPYKNLKVYAVTKKGIQIDGQIVYNKNRKDKIKIAVSPRQIKYSHILDNFEKHKLQTMPIPTFTTKILSLLLGEVDAAVYFPQKNKSANLWDYAAAVLLIEEAEYKISSLDGSRLEFNEHGIEHTKGWLASKKKYHQYLLNKLQLEIK